MLYPVYKESYVNDYHASEGFLVKSINGDIINIFRLSESPDSDHVDVSGKIVMRKSINDGKTWTEPVTVYDDEYDDRNVHGGITHEGRIVVFFRRHTGSATKDVNFIYSDDDGETWSDRKSIDTEGVTAGTHKMIYVPTRGYMQLIINHYYIEAWYSEDGSEWLEKDIVLDYRDTKKWHLNEACGVYLGNGKIMILVRDDERLKYHRYLQVTSEDYGKRWRSPRRTNITYPHWSPAPCVFYDEQEDKVWVVSTDRRSMYEGTDQYSQESIWVYKNNVDEVFKKEENFTLFTQEKRPYVMTSTNRPLNSNFYGYITSVKKSDGYYLFMVTDRYKKDNGKEGSDLFQFELKPKITISANLPVTEVGGFLKLKSDVSGVRWYSTDLNKATVLRDGSLIAKESGVVCIIALKNGYMSNKLWITIMDKDVNYQTFLNIEIEKNERISIPMFRTKYNYSPIYVQTPSGRKGFKFVDKPQKYPTLKMKINDKVLTVKGYD